MLYSDIIGQEGVKNRLRKMVNDGRVPHALLFSGNSGVGQLALAIATAQYICCENRGEDDACGRCPSCIKFAKLIHPDLHLTFPIVKSATKKIEVCDDVVNDFRGAVLENPYMSVNDWFGVSGEGKSGMIYSKEGDEIIRKLSFKAYESDFKIMVIWIPELMHDTCANHLLKFIEEPPEKTLFFLVTEDEERILGTIRSRSQLIRVPPIDLADMVKAGEKEYNMRYDDIQSYARLANGSWQRFKEEVCRSDADKYNFELFVRMMRLSWTLNVRDIRDWSNELGSMGRDEQKMFLQLAQKEVRENFISHFGENEMSYMNHDEHAFSLKFSRYIHENNVERIMEELALAEMQIDQNVNSKIIFFHLIFCLFKLLRISNK